MSIFAFVDQLIISKSAEPQSVDYHGWFDIFVIRKTETVIVVLWFKVTRVTGCGRDAYGRIRM